MLQLHQFRHSAFCEKVRLVLAAKRLDYTVVEVLPGLGQWQLFRLSGQRQVPVLVDGAEVIADSTAISLHLEARHPEPALLPADPRERAQVLLLEDWADTALAAGCRLALVQAAATDPVLRSALLPDSTPGPLRQLVSNLPSAVMALSADGLAPRVLAGVVSLSGGPSPRARSGWQPDAEAWLWPTGDGWMRSGEPPLAVVDGDAWEVGGTTFRAVTHLDVTRADVEHAAAVLKRALA
jgi:hypothetical protein